MAKTGAYPVAGAWCSNLIHQSLFCMKIQTEKHNYKYELRAIQSVRLFISSRETCAMRCAQSLFFQSANENGITCSPANEKLTRSYNKEYICTKHCGCSGIELSYFSFHQENSMYDSIDISNITAAGSILTFLHI
jgi:hypothetical protein